MQVWNVLHAACWKYRTQKNCHLRTIAQFCLAVSSQQRHVFTIGKKDLLNSDISSTCSHNMVNFSELTAEICLAVWGTPANFSGFCMLASLLHRRRSTEVNQILHYVSPSSGLVHYIYTFSRALAPNRILPGAKFTLRPSLAFSYIAALLHGTWAVGISQTLRHGTRNGITELSQRAPSIFGWAAFALGISSHSSWNII